MKRITDSHTTTARLLLFSIGLLVSFNSFAAPRGVPAQIAAL